MTVAVGSLSINAAFFHEIKQENQRLCELLCSVREITQNLPMRNGEQRQVVNSLEELCDQVALHFSLEEAYGYFAEAFDAAPRVIERAESLRDEHVVLFDTIRQIADDAVEAHINRRWTQGFTVVVDRFREFDERFQMHESQENALIQEAFDDDIGVGD